MPKAPKHIKSDIKKSSQKKEEDVPKHCQFDKCFEPIEVEVFCRLHYLRILKERREEKVKKNETRLNNFIEKLSKKYPKNVIDKLREGLESEEEFNKVVLELEEEGLVLDQDYDDYLKSDIEVDLDEETDIEFLEKFARKVKPESE